MEMQEFKIRSLLREVMNFMATKTYHKPFAKMLQRLHDVPLVAVAQLNSRVAICIREYTMLGLSQ